MVANNSNFSNATEIVVASYRLYFVGVQGVLALPIIFGNLLILVSWLKFKFLRKRSNILVVNLAVTDLSVGLIMIPYQICSYAFPQMASIREPCVLRYVIFLIFLLTSITTLLAISVERYIAIAHPLQYMQHVTGRRLVIIAITMWIVNGLFSVSPLLGWNAFQEGMMCIVHNVYTRNYRLILYSIILSCLFLNLAFFARVAITLLRRISGPREDDRPRDFNQTVDMSSRSMRMNVKHTKVMLIVLGLFIVCWLPSISLATIETVMGRSIPGLVVTKTFMLSTGIANSGLNWIIYGWKNHQFRKGFKMLMCCKRSKPPPIQSVLNMCVASSDVKESSDTSRTPSSIVTDICHV